MFQHHDLTVKKALRYLLIMQVAELIPLAILEILGARTLALFLLFLALIIGIGVSVFSYSRYRAHPLVAQKRVLLDRKSALEKGIEAEQRKIGATQQKRIALSRAQQGDVTGALQSLQRSYIEDGLRETGLAAAEIPGVGPKLKERLMAHGVTSAAHVNSTSISSVEGFGQVKISAVLNWRSEVLARLDGAKPSALPAEQAREINAKFQAQHAGNDQQEAGAKARALALQNDLANHLTKLEPFAPITFKNYITAAMATENGKAGKLSGVLVGTTILLYALTGVGLISSGARGAAAQPTLDYAAIGTSAFETALASSVQTIQAKAPIALGSPTALESPGALSSPAAVILPSVTATSLGLRASGIAGATCIPNNPLETARVVDVVDGDTIKVLLASDNKTHSLRYIGMDTAEMNPPGLFMAAEAKARNAQMASGKTAMLIKDVSEVDRYGRLLRYVVIDNLFINYQLVVEGFARSVAYPPDTACNSMFEGAQQRASAAAIGLWAPAPALIALPTAPKSGGSAPCNCNGPDLNCPSFGTHAKAQACYDYCNSAGFGDVFHLDGDHDGSACESLP